MALSYLPHTVTIESATQRVVGNDVVGRLLSAPVTVKCQVTPGNAKLVYEQHNMQLDSPQLLMCNPENASLFLIGSVVVFNGRRFVVRIVENWGAVEQINFANVILDSEKGS